MGDSAVDARANRAPEARMPHAWLWSHGPELVVGAATTVTLVLAVYQLDRRSFWLDEATSFYVSGVTWNRMLELLATGEQGWHPPTFFIALKAWRSIAGESQVALRSFSVVFAVASIPLIYLIARPIATRWTAAAAATLLSSNSFVIHYAQEARPYTLTMALAILSYWLLVGAMERSSSWRWLLFAVVAILGVYSHLFFGLIIAAQAVTVITVSGRRLGLSRPLLAFGLITICTLPLALGALMNAGRVEWIPPITLEALGLLIQDFSGGTLATLMVYVIGVALAARWMIGPGRGWKWAPMVLLWVILPATGLALLSLVKPLLVPRYVIMSLPALVILVAIGLTSTPKRAAFLLWMVALATSILAVRDSHAVEHRQWRELAVQVRNLGNHRDGVVLWESKYRKPLAFQVSRLGSENELPQLVTPPAPWSSNMYAREAAPDTGAARRLAACGYRRIWVVGGPADVSRHRNPAIAEVLTKAYDSHETIRVGDLRLHLLVRNDKACL